MSTCLGAVSCTTNRGRVASVWTETSVRNVTVAMLRISPSATGIRFESHARLFARLQFAERPRQLAVRGLAVVGGFDEMNCVPCGTAS